MNLMKGKSYGKVIQRNCGSDLAHLHPLLSLGLWYEENDREIGKVFHVTAKNWLVLLIFHRLIVVESTKLFSNTKMSKL